MSDDAQVTLVYPQGPNVGPEPVLLQHFSDLPPIRPGVPFQCNAGFARELMEAYPRFQIVPDPAPEPQEPEPETEPAGPDPEPAPRRRGTSKKDEVK